MWLYQIAKLWLYRSEWSCGSGVFGQSGETLVSRWRLLSTAPWWQLRPLWAQSQVQHWFLKVGSTLSSSLLNHMSTVWLCRSSTLSLFQHSDNIKLSLEQNREQSLEAFSYKQTTYEQTINNRPLKSKSKLQGTEWKKILLTGHMISPPLHRNWQVTVDFPISRISLKKPLLVLIIPKTGVDQVKHPSTNGKEMS